MVVLAPIPSASEMTITAVRAGFLKARRIANRISRSIALRRTARGMPSENRPDARLHRGGAPLHRRQVSGRGTTSSQRRQPELSNYRTLEPGRAIEAIELSNAVR